LKRVGECVATYNSNLDFKDQFHKLLNEMMSEDEFEAEWHSLQKFAKKAVYTTPFIIMNGVQHVHLVTFNVEKECSPYSINENRYNDLLQNSAN
jgi:hypothetical protein